MGNCSMRMVEISVIRYSSENEIKLNERVSIPAKIHALAWIPKAILFPSLRDLFALSSCILGEPTSLPRK